MSATRKQKEKENNNYNYNNNDNNDNNNNKKMEKVFTLWRFLPTSTQIVLPPTRSAHASTTSTTAMLSLLREKAIVEGEGEEEGDGGGSEKL